MSRYDELEKDYKPKFVSYPKYKPTLSAQKKQLIFFYLGSYFRKFTKNEILNNWNHHAFYWDEKEHLILNLHFLSYHDFCDKNESYGERADIIEKLKKARDNKEKIELDAYHDRIYFLYDFNSNKIAIQGYLIDKKHKRYENDELIEDIEKFNDDDLDYILSRNMVNYDIRDQEIDDFLKGVKNEFPIKRFYHFKTNYWNDNDVSIGYLTKVEAIHKEKKAILHITKYSISSESLSTKKDDKHKIEITFLHKENDIKKIKLKLLEDIYVKKKIYDTRKSKINDLKNKNVSNQKSIEKYHETIKASESAISILEQDIKERTTLIEQQIKDLKNTVIENIKLL